MILRNLEKYKVGVTEEAVTSFAGLPLFLQMGKSMGLEKELNELKIKERESGYKPAEVAFALMGLLQSGGVALDDIDLLRGDEGMRVMMGEMPAANTVGEYLRRFGDKTIYALGRKVMENGVKVIRGKKLKRVTLDVDAFTVESQKAGVEMNYKGEWGYTPIAVSCGRSFHAPHTNPSMPISSGLPG